MSRTDVFLLFVLFIKEFANCQHPCGDNLSKVDQNETVVGDGSVNVEFDCLITGVTSSLHSWFKLDLPDNNLELISEGGQYVLQETFDRELIIINVTKENEAFYNCTHMSNGNPERTSFCLTVLGYPAFLSCSELEGGCERNVSKGGNVSFNVQFTNMFAGALNEIVDVNFVRIGGNGTILNTCNIGGCAIGETSSDFPNITLSVTSVTQDATYTISAFYSDTQVPSKTYLVTVQITTPISTSETTTIDSPTSSVLSTSATSVSVLATPSVISSNMSEGMTSSPLSMPSMSTTAASQPTSSNRTDRVLTGGIVGGVVVFLLVVLLALVLVVAFLFKRRSKGKFSVFPNGAVNNATDAGTIVGTHDEKAFHMLDQSLNSVPRSI